MYIVSTAPATEPLTLTECKLHLKVDHTDDDNLITMQLQAAREQVEQLTNRALMTQTIKQYYDSFPCNDFYLRFAPVQSVTSIKYYDTDNVQQTLVADTDYQVDLITTPPRIVELVAWPATKAKGNAVEIEFVAGYANAASVPAMLKTIILLILGEMYENRENTVKRLPTHVDDLISLQKVIQ